jgi:hypothetical protein
MAPKRHKSSFIERHCDQYGLRITTRNDKGEVESVVCRFCLAFKREECDDDDDDDDNASARKRKRTSNIKYFSSFRADNYKKHLTLQHPTKWSEYQALNHDATSISDFFATDIPFVNTLDAHFDIEKSISHVIDAKIVNTIIGDMLFDAEDEDDLLSKKQALAMFKRNVDSDSYKVEIKNARRFRLICGFIACGSTIRLCSRLLQTTKEETNLAYLGGASEMKIRQHVRTVVIFPCKIFLMQ